ncbi:hypothetical protein [Compostibacter hankyongensis]|uniref:Uncharacterized protein n=1 Tax=Compostibacter hankyongensis TaxID=1007089 RepID=A0ABP8G4B0_9BACT
MKNMIDLRFVVGFFFLLVGIMLLIVSFTGQTGLPVGETINRDCGIVFVVFSLVMLAMWKWGGMEKNAEESEHVSTDN